MPGKKPPLLAPGREGFVSADLVGTYLNVDAITVRRLAREGVIPQPKEGFFNLVASVQAYVKHLQNRQANKQAASQKEAAARKEAAMAEQRELQVAIMKKQYLSVEEVRDEWLGLANVIKTGFRGLPAKCSSHLLECHTVGEVRGLLTDEINAVLAELSNTKSIPQPPKKASVTSAKKTRTTKPKPKRSTR